jgi:hypothetical protein
MLDVKPWVVDPRTKKKQKFPQRKLLPKPEGGLNAHHVGAMTDSGGQRDDTSQQWTGTRRPSH